jgi:TolB-like protein/Tfp pilus assembly protein PilF
MGREPNVVGNVSAAQNRQLRFSESAAHLHVHLLGPVTITSDGRSVAIASKKARALLGYLALREGTEVPRSILTGLLWGERSESQARASLRQTLSELRTALASSAQRSIIATKEAITWVSGSAWIDAKTLESAARSEDESTLRKAADLIGGELMEGMSVSEAAFEEWLASERERFRLVACSIYARLVERAEQSGKLEEALNFGLRLLSLDPLQENVHRTLMRLFAAQGRHDAALAQYERCRRELSGGLGVAPQPETEALARAIRTSRRDGPTKPQTSLSSSDEAHRSNWPARADRPSVAVLPFTNLSSDPEQQYFSDGITEDIISGLTRLHWLFVIARDSSFIFKNKAIDTKQVGGELGVRYLLEGSIRKAGDRVRIASQLIDAATGTHIWADHFDGALSDIFDLQDQITARVVGAIEPKLRRAEIERARRKPTASVDAYDLFLRALALNNTRKEEDNKQALRLLYQAIEIDRHYAAAYGLAGYCYLRQKTQGFASPADPVLPEGMRMARLAAEYGQDDSEALWMAGVTMSFLAGKVEDGLALIDRSLALNPNSANALMASGLVRAVIGETDSAIPPLEKSRQLSPLDSIAYGASLGFAWVHFMAGRYEEASSACDRTLHEAPTYYPPALHVKIACCGLLGRLEEGRKWVERLLAVNPEARVSTLHEWFRLFIRKSAGLEALLDGMRRAGLPE